MNNEIKRIKYLDILRALAIVAVVTIHISSQSYISENANSYQQIIFLIFNNLVQWAVPMFCAISGSLFLNSNKCISFKELFCKYIRRLLRVYFIWSFLYALFNAIKKTNFSINSFIRNLIIGEYHLWYLILLVGIYLLVPILKKISESKQSLSYFILLDLFFVYFIPLFNNVSYLPTLFGRLSHCSISIYVLCFAVGYYISRYDISKIFRVIIYCLGIVSFICPIVLAINNIESSIENINYYYSYSGVFCFLQVCSIYTFAKYNFDNKIINNIITDTLAKYSFGIYLIHPFIIEILEHFGFNVLMFNPILNILFIIVLVILISTLFSYVLNKIPLFKKYLF